MSKAACTDRKQGRLDISSPLSAACFWCPKPILDGALFWTALLFDVVVRVLLPESEVVSRVKVARFEKGHTTTQKTKGDAEEVLASLYDIDEHLNGQQFEQLG
jgi:hypothetical protein